MKKVLEKINPIFPKVFKVGDVTKNGINSAKTAEREWLIKSPELPHVIVNLSLSNGSRNISAGV